MTTLADVPLIIVSDNASSERRITPAWSIDQLKTKLEPITGVPPSSQRLSLKTAGSQIIPIEAADEENTYLASFPLAPYAELHVRSFYSSPLAAEFIAATWHQCKPSGGAQRAKHSVTMTSKGACRGCGFCHHAGLRRN
jgi:hypothetical protein